MAVVVDLMKRYTADSTIITADTTIYTADGDGPPFYLYGYEWEINNRLLQRHTDREMVFKRYPLVALRLPAPRSVVGNVQEYTINLAIMTLAKRDMNSEERTNLVYKPVLYPLVTMFFKALRQSGLFTWSGRPVPPHDQIDRMYYGRGSGDKREANVFSDPIDAVEIMNLKISSQIKC
jgi:hypothetical protein